MLLDAYREVYYTGGVSSVYLWDLEDSAEEGVQDRAGPAAGSFAGCFLILKRVGGEGEGSAVGSWESSHVMQVCIRLQQCQGHLLHFFFKVCLHCWQDDSVPSVRPVCFEPFLTPAHLVFRWSWCGHRRLLTSPFHHRRSNWTDTILRKPRTSSTPRSVRDFEEEGGIAKKKKKYR